MKLLITLNKFGLVVLSSIILTACSSNSNSGFVAAPMVYDQGFALHKNIKVETEQTIFYLDDSAKMFVEQTIGKVKKPTDKMKELIYSVFDRSKMNLLYQGEANTVASETFYAKAANCLSMSIMMYALANEAGFDVTFQEIMVPEYWTRRQGYSLLNGHINLRISPRVPPHIFSFRRPRYNVDFDPQYTRYSLPNRVASKQDVMAMFYNNIGADALVKHDYDKAYVYFREATLYKPKFQSAWINLGILYRHKGFFDKAEEAYRYALYLDGKSLTAAENLAYLYYHTNRQKEADDIMVNVRNKRKKNPYYHLNLGEEQFEKANWQQALAHFRKALTLDRNKHEIYYGLAKTYYEIGEVAESQRYLKIAKNKATNDHLESRYQSKLNFLHDL